MKIITFKGAVRAVFIALFLILFSTEVKKVNSAEFTVPVQTPGMPVLKNIDIVDLPASTQILLDAGNSLKYTSFRLIDPPRLVIDLSGISLGEFNKPIIVGKGSIIQIDPVEADTPVRIARLNIRLVSEAAEPQIYSKANVLIIDIPKIAPDAPPLNMVRNLSFQKSDDKDSIIITADNEITAETFIVEGNKLVVDVKDAGNSITPYEKAVDSDLISKIRIGLHPAPVNKVRFVADLKKAIKFDVNKQGKELTINVFSKKEKMQPAVQLASLAPVPVSETNSNNTNEGSSPASSPSLAPTPTPSIATGTNTNLKVNNPPAAGTSQAATKVEKEEKFPDSPQATNPVIEKKNGNYNGKKVSLD
ncbi:MAG: AMIN domain-containing protein, partial [Nitrospirota bacterium]